MPPFQWKTLIGWLVMSIALLFAAARIGYGQGASPESPKSVEKAPQPTAALIEDFLNAEHDWQQKEMADELVVRGGPAVLAAMTNMLDSPNRRRRCNAGFVLAKLDEPRGIAVIIRELRDQLPRPTELQGSNGQPDIAGQVTADRYYAVVLLGQLASKDAVPALIEATTDSRIHYAAAISLGQIGDKRAISALRKMADDFPDQKLWAGYGLAALGEAQGFELLTAIVLSDSRWTERRHAVEALGTVGHRQAVPVLISSLKDKHANVRVSAARALGQIGDQAARSALQAALDDMEATEVNAPTTVAAEARKALDVLATKPK